MKRSDFSRKRARHWLAQGMITDTIRMDHVRQDIEAAEAAGIAWEPEAPALPERLYLRQDRLAILATAPGIEYIVALVHADNGFVPSVGAIRASILTEAVRRYNAFPAIRAWAGRHHAGEGVGGLMGILDGPAE